MASVTSALLLLLSVCLLDHPATDLPPAARLGMDLAKPRTPGQLTKLLMRQSRLGVRAEPHGHPLWQPRCAFGGGFLCKPMDFIPLGQPCGAPSPARAASRDDDGITVVPFPQLLPGCRAPSSALLFISLFISKGAEESEAAADKGPAAAGGAGSRAPAPVLTLCFHWSEKAPRRAGESPAVRADQHNKGWIWQHPPDKPGDAATQ